MTVLTHAVLVTLFAGAASPASMSPGFFCGESARAGTYGVRAGKAHLADGPGTLVVATGAVRLGILHAVAPPWSGDQDAGRDGDDRDLRFVPNVSFVLDSAGAPIARPNVDGSCVVVPGRHPDVRIGRISELDDDEEGPAQQRMLAAVKGPPAKVQRLERVVTSDGTDLLFGLLDQCASNCDAEQAHHETGVLLGPAPARELLAARPDWEDVVMVYSLGSETRFVDRYARWESWHWSLDRLDAHALIAGPTMATGSD